MTGSSSVLRHRSVVGPERAEARAGHAHRRAGRHVPAGAQRGRSWRCGGCRTGSGRRSSCRYYADLSEAQIAEMMGISKGAVKSHTARGMSSLRAVLEQTA